MVIDPTTSRAIAALQLLKPMAQAGAATRPFLAPAPEPMAKPRLGPGVSDALSRIGQTAVGTRIEDLPADHAARLRSYGADTAIRVPEPSVSDEEFQSRVMTYIKESWGGLEGFSEALANGAVKIQRASDVPELGYETIQYTMYKDGSLFGGAGWSTVNMTYYSAQTAAGVRQGLGSIEDLDYYVTW